MNTYDKYHKSQFCIDADHFGPFTGWTNGSDWNGWECPLFPHTEATRILTETDKGTESGILWEYVPATDTFLVYFEGYEDLEEIKGQSVLTVTGETITAYAVCDGWCWDEYTPADYDSDCPLCLRGIQHSESQHNQALDRQYNASTAELDSDLE